MNALRVLPKANIPALASLLAVFLGLLASGCGEPVSGYRLPDHDPRTASKILVLPFMDARTFRDDKDPLDAQAESIARDIFVAALKRHPVFKDKAIYTPEVDRDKTSLSLSQALDYGFRFESDLVIAGQVFSYTETRAASIPPRAGMFIRIFSTSEKRVVFVGDHYQSAGAPGATGGRQRQAELVADTLIANYAALAGTAPLPADPSFRPPTVLQAAPGNAPRILVLPYHERINPNNLIEKTGGGAVVTSLISMELGRLAFSELLTPATGRAGHGSLLGVTEALALGRDMGAQYVLRGQVVEFRRAVSVPSFYSVLISTALLAAQVLFAEMSGIDIATELWRVEDGECLFANRDVSRQKYVVQAEKTVRKVASTLAPALRDAVLSPPRQPAAPLIDSIVVEDRTRSSNRDEAESGPGQSRLGSD